MPKRVRAARHYQRDDDPVLRLSRSAMRGVARELQHAFNNLSSMVPVKSVAEAIRNGRDPKGLINWHHYREVLRGAFDRLGKLRHAGGTLGARKINGAFAAKRRKVRFRKAGYKHFVTEGAVLGATKFAATRKASKAQAGYEERSSHGATCSGCWMFQAVWQCCAVEGVINPNGWCMYWETVFAKAGGDHYDPNEPRDEHGRWTTGGSSLHDRIRDAYRSLGGGGDAVRLHMLRSVLADVPRAEMDRALLDMKNSGEAVLMHLDNPRDRAEVGSAGELRTESDVYHTVWLDPTKAPVGKAYNPDEPRDERGRWTSGGETDFPAAGAKVDGLAVESGDIPNAGSIGSSLDDYTVLPGIREVPFSAFEAAGSPSNTARTRALSEEIKANGYIKPLIVVVEENNLAAGPYILEGSHRFDALQLAGKKSFPALVVIDHQKFGKRIAKATGDQFNFDSFSPAVQAAARAEQDRLIQQLEADARNTIDAVISAGLADGTSADDMASEIADVIGLTETQWNAVDNYRNMLEELDPDSLVRRLRNTEYDAVVQDSIDAQTDLSEAAIENMVSDYIENYIDYRAATIAQTESTRAANLGLHDAYDQAIERGALTDGAVTRFWQLGDNPCPVCESIVDSNPDGVGVAEAFDSLDGPIDDPPVHPNCECSVDYVTDLSQVPDDGEEDRFGGGPGSFGVGGVDTPFMDEGGEE